MAVNLVELAKGYLTPDVIQKAASFVGESESATQKAMSGILPTLIAAVANQTSTTSGAEKLSRMLDTGKYDGSALNNLGSLFGGGETTQKAVTQGKDTPKLPVRQQDRGPRGSDRALGGCSHWLCLVPIGLGRAADPESSWPPACHHRTEPLGPGLAARRAEKLPEWPVADGDRFVSRMDWL